MFPGLYITHDNFDQTLVTLYTYMKHHQHNPDEIMVVERQPLTHEQKSQIATIMPVTYMSPGPALHKHLTGVNKTQDITGRLFESSIDGLPDRVAVVVYVYYVEYWQQILNYIKLLSTITSVDVHVYLCTDNSGQDAERLFKTTQGENNIRLLMNWTPNKGRDVRSFLRFVVGGKHSNYDYICKIHTKKTTYLDDNWRESYLKQLLNVESAKSTWCKLREGEHISTTDKYNIYEKYVSSNVNFKQLKEILKLYRHRLKLHSRYSFSAGTMFWCTSGFCDKVAAKINNKYLDKFEPEPIGNDGSLAHAWERAFHII